LRSRLEDISGREIDYEAKGGRRSQGRELNGKIINFSSFIGKFQ
jgi:hypothetical protein